MNSFLYVIIVIVFIIFFAGCDAFRAASIHSKWRQQEIVIDGIDTVDWLDAEVYVEAGDKFGISVRNDKEFIYIRMISMDQMIKMRFLRQGVKMWFDSTGSEKKFFGIRYPLGALVMPTQNQNEKEGSLGDLRNHDPQDMFDKIVEIFGIISKTGV